jgi:hypothetical protein
MMPQRTDIPNNTPEQAREYLEAALELVEQLEPPAELREHVFNRAVELLSGKQILVSQPPSVSPFAGLPR